MCGFMFVFVFVFEIKVLSLIIFYILKVILFGYCLRNVKS